MLCKQWFRIMIPIQVPDLFPSEFPQYMLISFLALNTAFCTSYLVRNIKSWSSFKTSAKKDMRRAFLSVPGWSKTCVTRMFLMVTVRMRPSAWTARSQPRSEVLASDILVYQGNIFYFILKEEPFVFESGSPEFVVPMPLSTQRAYGEGAKAQSEPGCNYCWSKKLPRTGGALHQLQRSWRYATSSCLDHDSRMALTLFWSIKSGEKFKHLWRTEPEPSSFSHLLALVIGSGSLVGNKGVVSSWSYWSVLASLTITDPSRILHNCLAVSSCLT